MRKSLVVMCAIAAVAATSALAGGQNEAGCGWGSMLFKQDDMPSQIVAATTNGTFGNQTFGITSGTAGCAASGSLKLGQVKQKQADFVTVNFREINRQVAAGGGEYVTSLSTLLGCSENVAPDFAKFTQSNYSTLFPGNAAPDAMLKTLRAEMMKEPKLASSCTLL